MNEEAFTVVTVREAVTFVLRGLPLALLFALAAGAGTWLAFRSQPVTFTAVSSLVSVRQDAQPTVVRSMAAGSLDPTLYRAAVVNGTVLDAVMAGWNGPEPLPEREELLKDLRVLSDNQLQSSIVRVEYRSYDARLAAGVVNAVARELLSWDHERTMWPLLRRREQLQAHLERLQERQDTANEAALQEQQAELVRELAQLEAVIPLQQLSMLAPATVPDAPDPQGRLSAFSIAAVSAALAAYGLRLLRTAA